VGRIQHMHVHKSTRGLSIWQLSGLAKREKKGKKEKKRKKENNNNKKKQNKKNKQTKTLVAFYSLIQYRQKHSNTQDQLGSNLPLTITLTPTSILTLTIIQITLEINKKSILTLNM
jgi:hypothetical protein